jgi:hypothetical protein
VTGAVTSGFRANEMASMTRNCRKCSPARTRFQRNRLVDRSLSIGVVRETGTTAASIGCNLGERSAASCPAQGAADRQFSVKGQ